MLVQEEDIKTSVELLKSIFPDNDEETIKSALEASKNDIELAMSIILSEYSNPETTVLSDDENGNADKPEVESELQILKAMFPNIDEKKIQTLLEESQGKYDIIPELLNFELLTMEEVPQQDKLVESIKAIETGDIQSKNAWALKDRYIKLIINHTSVSKEKAAHFYFKNSCDHILAILDIIQSSNTSNTNASSSVSTIKQSFSADKNTLSLKNIKGGRVQTNNSFAHAKKYADAKMNNNIFSVLDTDSKPNNIEEEESFQRELIDEGIIDDFINSNPAIKKLGRDFIYQIYIFCKGDLDKTISLALLFLENNVVDNKSIMKPDIYKINTQYNDTNSPGWIATASYKQKGKNSKKNQKLVIPKTGFSTTSNYNLAVHMVDKLFEDFRLDFHGFLPSEAIIILEFSLNLWWNSELEQRELGVKKLSGSKALTMQPVMVITGRGIHSVNGVSKVRIQVKKYLTTHGFVFLEEASYFVIEGKSSKH